MNLTPRQQRVFDCILALHDAGTPIRTKLIAEDLAVSPKSIWHHLRTLREKGLIVYYDTLRRWALPPSDEPDLPDTWSMARAAAFGITVRVVEDAPIGGRLLQVGFDYEYLWPKSQTHHIDWQRDIDNSVRLAGREVIRRAARGMNISELDAELYLVRHARVRAERREAMAC